MTVTVFDLSPRMLHARASCLAAQAHLDALSGKPEHILWAAVMDAYLESFRSVGETPAVSCPQGAP